jgi:ankyrin repeat protein
MPNNKKGKRSGKAGQKNVNVAGNSHTLWTVCLKKTHASGNRENVRRVKDAIAAGADVNYSHDDYSCLAAAATGGDVEIVKLLLAAGADKDAKDQQGFTPLFFATMGGNTKCIGVLINAGADKDTMNNQGFTPLLCASQRGDDHCVAMLLAAGANVDAKQQQGYSALIVASEIGHPKTVELLLKGGADKDAKTSQRTTALHGAAQVGSNDCIKLLVTAGCNVNALDINGMTALHLAVKHNHTVCLDTLISAGTDLSIQVNGRSLEDFLEETNALGGMKHCSLEPCGAGSRNAEDFARCARCKTAYYCNRECQARHWPRHKVVCKRTD